MPDQRSFSAARRGSWIGMRTLRLRPKLVDHTDSGDTIFEARSVRLLLRPDADHFHRLETCTGCGGPVTGEPVLDPADLDRPTKPLTCTGCARAGGAPAAGWRGPDRRPEADLVPGAGGTPAGGEDAGGRTAGDEMPEGGRGPGSGTPRMAAGAGGIRAAGAVRAGGVRSAGAGGDGDVREELQAVAATLASQQRELGVLGAGLLDARRELVAVAESQEALAQSQRELGLRLVETSEAAAAMSAPAGAGEPAGAAGLSQDLQTVTELLRAHQRELRTLSRDLAETQTGLGVVTESQQELARAQQGLDQRLTEGPSRDSGAAAVGTRLEVLERRLEEVAATLASGVAHARAEASDLVVQLSEQLTTLAHLVADQRGGAAADPPGLADAVAALGAAQARTDSQLLHLGRRLEALLAEVIGDDGCAEPEGAQGHPRRRDAPAGGILEALDRQLAEAEGRLSRHARPTPSS